MSLTPSLHALWLTQRSKSHNLHMSSSKQDYILKCWPDDILIMIFCKLDIKSLLNCMQVNHQWREIAVYCFQHFNLWEKVIEEIIHNSATKFKEKSTLDFQNLFTCVQQWFYIKKANITYQYDYKSGYVNNICVYKDKFILVSDETVKYYNVNGHTLIKTIPSKCLKYEETYAFSAEVAIPVGRLENNLLVLINKLHKNDCVCTTGKKMVLCRIYLIKLYLNECYLIDNKNALRVFRAEYCQWHENVLARHYGVVGSISDISIYKDDIYVLLKRGDVLYLDKQCRKFEKIFQFDTPLLSMSTNLFTFHAYSKLISVPSDVKMQIYLQNKQDQIAMVCPGLTCALEHGPALFMAFDNMKIEIYLTKKLLKNISKPELSIDLTTYLQKSQLESKIKALDIYESMDGHHLFVVTDTDVHEFLIS